MNYRDIIRSLFSNSFIRIVSMLIGMILNVYIVRSLGADESGKYYFLIGLIGTLASTSSLGLNNWLIREVTKNKESHVVNNLILNVIMRVLLFSLLVVSFLWYFAESIFVVLGRKGLENQLIILLPVIFLLAAKPYFVAVYQASDKIKTASLFQSVILPLFTLIVLFTYGVSFSYEMVDVYAFSTTLAVLIIFIHYLHAFGVSLKFSFKKIDGFESFFLLHLIYNFTPLCLLFINGFFLNNSEFAIYNASFRITVLASFILIVFNFVSAPKYSRYYNEGNINDLISYSQLVSKLILLLLTPILIIIFFASDTIMSLYGSEFREYGYILLILFVGQFSNAIFGSAGYILTLTGHEKDLKNWNFLAMPVNFAISFFCLYVWGLTGAAVATTVSTIITNFISYGLVVNKLGFSIIKLR